MSTDNAGTYTLPGDALANGQVADATVMQEKLADIAAGLTERITKTGKTIYTANQPMGGFRHTGVGAAVARTEYARADQVIGSVLDYAADSGSGTAYATAPSPGITAYVVGQRFSFKAANANSGADPTLAVNGLATGIIYWPDGSSLAAGDIPANAQIVVQVATLTPTFHLQTAAGFVRKGLLDTKGDLIVATSDNTPAVLPAGANGRVLMARSADAKGLVYVPALTGVINGLTYGNNASDATNDIDIAAGGCMDATGAYWLQISAITKRLDASWAVGTNQGGLDTGSIADTGYFIWAIARSDTGVTDVLFSTSATAPTMPANYDYKRLFGWFRRASSAIVAFKTYETAGGGIEFAWSAPTVDVSAATVGTSRSLQTVRVPSGLSVQATLAVTLSFAAGVTQSLNISCPDQADAGVNATTAIQGTAGFNQSVGLSSGGQFVDTNSGSVAWTQRVRTNSSAQVAMRASGASATVNASTIGFEWSRR